MLPENVVDLIFRFPFARPMSVLQMAVSALAVAAAAGEDPAPGIDPAERLLARVSAIFVTQHGARNGLRKQEVREKWATATEQDYARWLLAGLDVQAEPQRVAALNTCLVIQAEHGSNASAFAARVATGTGSDIYSAVTAAIATFDGPLHGGAAEGVMAMVQEIGDDPQDAVRYVERRRAENQPVMGFGHRVYRTEDPRGRNLRSTAIKLAEITGNGRVINALEAVRRVMLPLRSYGLDVNVDFYSGAIYDQLGIPSGLFVPIFVAARTAGWLAHIKEQRDNNILIRPLLRYIGDGHRRYPAASTLDAK